MTTILHTVIINTLDMDRLTAFYGPGLGIGDPGTILPDHIGWQLENLYFGFDHVSEAAAYPGAISLWFEVDDLQVTYDRFVEMGANSIYGPTRKPWGAVLAAVYDPDGNVVGLAQRGTT